MTTVRRAHFSLSIRAKMILIVVSTMVVGIAFTAFMIRQVVFDNILRNKMKTVEILTQSLVYEVKYGFQEHGRSNTQNVIAKFITYYRIISNISFYNVDFLNTASSDAQQIGKTTDDPDVVTAITMAKPALHVTHPDWSNFGIRSVSPILLGSRVVGAVSMDVSILDIQQTLGAIDQRILVILIIQVTLVSLALYIMLRRSILVRLNHLMNVTGHIASGNYDILVPDRRNDEIGKLGQALNRMTADLKRSKHELDKHNEHLEATVRDATAQLQKAYEDLKSAQGQLVLNEKMASLGVLIAGIAHEINTPIASILNISRNLTKRIATLPRGLTAFKGETTVSEANILRCLEEIIETSSKQARPPTYRETRTVEVLLEDEGIDSPYQRASQLAKLNLTNPDRIREHIDCFRLPWFFEFAESFGSIAQGAKISESSSQKITEIVRALKYYAYSDRGKVEFIQVNESIQNALILLRNRMKDSTTVVTDLQGDLPAVPCTSEIHQVWTNLLTNACDAIEAVRSDGEGQIVITTHRSGSQVVVTVRDNGIGIPESIVDKVFDPFFTTKDIGKGTGLGLGIVSGIVKKHRGTVKVQSTPGETVFEIALPIEPGPRESGNDPSLFEVATGVAAASAANSGGQHA